VNAYRELDTIYRAFHINGCEHETDVVPLFEDLQRICAIGRLGCPIAGPSTRNNRFCADAPILLYDEDYVFLIMAV
jgi:hypothetical protein